MIFSKSFGYAVRGIMYIAIMQEEHRYVQVEEISRQLSVPRHFLGKILKKLVKENLLHSIKGPMGGFRLNENSLTVPLIDVLEITDGISAFSTCVLKWKECDAENPCPMHAEIEKIKLRLQNVLMDTTINHLMKEDKLALMQSISTNIELNCQP